MTAVLERTLRCAGPCGKVKSEGEFYRNSQNSSGRESYCKVCKIEASRRLRDGVAIAPRRRGKATVIYPSAHHRVKHFRGRASFFDCFDGCGEKAQDWSYDGRDPDELISYEEGSKGCAYSLNPMHYVPRCRPCHKRHDSTMRGE